MVREIDPEELRGLMVELLSRPPAKVPEDRKPTENTDITTLDFDFDALRLMVYTKLRKTKGPRGHGYKFLSREIGVADTALGAFLRGYGTPTVRTTMRLMAWLGYHDFREFAIDHDD